MKFKIVPTKPEIKKRRNLPSGAPAHRLSRRLGWHGAERVEHLRRFPRRQEVPVFGGDEQLRGRRAPGFSAGGEIKMNDLGVQACFRLGAECVEMKRR